MPPMNALRSAAMLFFAASSVVVSHAQAPAAAGQTVTAVKPRAVADRVAALLEADYLDAETGQAYAARVREQAARGAYDGLVGAALADRLTLDLLAVKDDRHLRVRFGAPMMRMMSGPIGPGGPGPGRDTNAPPSTGRPPAPMAPAIEQAGWIAPGIAYIRFNEFPPEAAVTEATRAFLRDHANAATLIFDLRTNRGGGPAQMDVIFPMLFSKPTRLVDMATRSGNERLGPGGPNLRPAGDGRSFVKEYWVTPSAESSLRQSRVFVLISPATGSAGEMFAAALKWSGRATLIGAPTAGANHFVSMQPLDGGLTLFVPVGRTFNPADGKDWEGDGVAPDIAVAPEQALTTALVRAGLPEAQAASFAEQYRPSLPMTRPPAIGPR